MSTDGLISSKNELSDLIKSNPKIQTEQNNR